MADNGKGDKLSAGERLAREWATTLSNIHGGTLGHGGNPIYALYIRSKSGGVWVAVAKRLSVEADEHQVAFGSGGSPINALRELNASIARGKWRKDLPWRGGGE